MPWKTKNYKGEDVIWYSEKEYNKLKEELEWTKEILSAPNLTFLSWEPDEEL